VKAYYAENGFANPSNPRFDKVATKDAYTHVMAFTKEKR
jgi:carboxymethylenebutenolidase